MERTEDINTLDTDTFKVRHIPHKRILDLILASFCLILGVIPFLLIALIIRLTSRGAVVFSHERIGRGGTPFRCYKFRTMHLDAEKILADLLAHDEAAKIEWASQHKLKNDPRITTVGKWLRKTSLDELPQLWNVLKGDLSLVGPRPVMRNELIRHYRGKSRKILSVRPGITGLWQVSGRSLTGYSQRVQLDESYVDNQTLLLDLKIMLKTIPALLSMRGAY